MLKGINQKNRMYALVDNSIFTIICDIIKVKSITTANDD